METTILNIMPFLTILCKTFILILTLCLKLLLYLMVIEFLNNINRYLRNLNKNYYQKKRPIKDITFKNKGEKR